MAVILLVPFFVKIPKGLNNHPVIGPFGDELHVFLFIAVTLLLYWLGPFRGRLWWTVAAAMVAGALIEVIQIPFDRTPQIKDFFLDLLGIGLVAGWILWRGERKKWGRALLIALLMVLPLTAWRLPFIAAAASSTRDRFPVVADFEGRYDGWLWVANMDAEFGVVAVEDGPEGPTRVLRLTGAPPTNWPGVFIRRFQRDWTGYHTLEADVRMVEGPATGARMALRIADMQGIKDHVWISKGDDIDGAGRAIRCRFEGRDMPGGEPRKVGHADLETMSVYLP